MADTKKAPATRADAKTTDDDKTKADDKATADTTQAPPASDDKTGSGAGNAGVDNAAQAADAEKDDDGATDEKDESGTLTDNIRLDREVQAEDEGIFTGYVVDGTDIPASAPGTEGLPVTKS